MKSLEIIIGAMLMPTLITLLGLAAVPAALGQSCCSAQTGSHAGCDMAAHTASDGHDGHDNAQAAASGQNRGERHVFMKPVQSVFDNYIKVQGTLAQDSLEGIGSTARAMAEVIRADSMKRLSPKVAEQAEALAKAKDLPTARAAFKPLSESLIGYFKEHKPSADSYYVAYCPMAKASWLQTDKTIINLNNLIWARQ